MLESLDKYKTGFCWVQLPGAVPGVCQRPLAPHQRAGQSTLRGFLHQADHQPRPSGLH
jgi:hypothetical protein